MASGNDHRQFPRIDRNALLAYEVLQDGKVGDLGMARTRDISLKGLALELPRAPAIGSLIRIELAIANDRFKVTARVMRVHKEQEAIIVGVELVQIPDEYLEIVEDLLNG